MMMMMMYEHQTKRKEEEEEKLFLNPLEYCLFLFVFCTQKKKVKGRVFQSFQHLTSIVSNATCVKIVTHKQKSQPRDLF
jgi:hypothetical protein